MEPALTPRQLAVQICQTLRASSHQAFLVGGCVRDEILGRVPADYDIATDAVPSHVEELFPGSLTVGAKFGVVVVPRGDLHVEVATFRSDVGYSDGRHPDKVVYSQTPQEDGQPALKGGRIVQARAGGGVVALDPFRAGSNAEIATIGSDTIARAQVGSAASGIALGSLLLDL